MCCTGLGPRDEADLPQAPRHRSPGRRPGPRAPPTRAPLRLRPALQAVPGPPLEEGGWRYLQCWLGSARGAQKHPTPLFSKAGRGVLGGHWGPRLRAARSPLPLCKLGPREPLLSSNSWGPWAAVSPLPPRPAGSDLCDSAGAVAATRAGCHLPSTCPGLGCARLLPPPPGTQKPRPNEQHGLEGAAGGVLCLPVSSGEGVGQRSRSRDPLDQGHCLRGGPFRGPGAHESCELPGTCTFHDTRAHSHSPIALPSLFPSHVCMQTRMCARTHTQIHTHTDTHANTHRHTHMQTGTQTHTHTRRHTHMRTHTETYAFIASHILDGAWTHNNNNNTTIVILLTCG